MRLRDKSSSKVMSPILYLYSCCLLAFVLQCCPQISADPLSKIAGFKDPNTGYLYRITTTDSAYKSQIKVSRVQVDPLSGRFLGEYEFVQTLNFQPSLVDFDIDCVPTHCYLVAITNRTKRNIELYSWQRTQFDLKAKRDSFARPHQVTLFRINSGFYIALAQEQIHLTSNRLAPDYDESPRFVGSAILKFTKGQEHNVRYHQFVKLPFNPLFVEYRPSLNTNNISTSAQDKPAENHHLIFSTNPQWFEPNAGPTSSFIWSPLNDHFWPHKLPKNVTVEIPNDYPHPILKIPTEIPRLDLTQSSPLDSMAPVESCFYQLQRLLAQRELTARRLIESSRSLWRTHHGLNKQQPINQRTNLTDISTRVVVHGNVVVKGSLIESPQISIIARATPRTHTLNHVNQLVDSHSPTIVENRLKQAKYRLGHVRDKISRAVLANLPTSGILQFSSPIKFFRNIQANNIQFNFGVSNSDVRFNGIPFRQLDQERVSLHGAQDIAAKVIFTGNVVADLLEIHGEINEERYRLRDAIDITSRRIQVIDTGLSNAVPTYLSASRTLEFVSISASDIIMAPNSTFNDILLNDFITRDSRDQFIVGRKSFKRLSMGQLDLANPHVLLNDLHIAKLATFALRARPLSDIAYQTLNGKSLFTNTIRVNRLTINNLVNNRVNVTSLIHDSVKAVGDEPQYLSGHKNFQAGLTINRLMTAGSINNVFISQIFNLNPQPPQPDYYNYPDPNQFYSQPPITGVYTFKGSVDILSNLNTVFLNGVDLSARAIRRIPRTEANYSSLVANPQVVTGHKIFFRPLRVIERIKIIDKPVGSIPTRSYPTINGFDFKLIIAGIKRQRQNPSHIYIENLHIDGNLNLDMSLAASTRTTLGNYSSCPLDSLKSSYILSSSDEQFIKIPMRIDSIRATSAFLEPGSFNKMNFPDDFVLRSSSSNPFNGPNIVPIQPVFGHKSFDHLVMAPTLVSNSLRGIKMPDSTSGILFGSRSAINDLTYNELQKFVSHERQKNSTGETILKNLSVHGNIYAKKVNGYQWPQDIILKAYGAYGGPLPSPLVHRRIYSPVIFLNSSFLEVENQLVLRGPVQLAGRLNGINLTEFSYQSVTYGDKDLFSIGRPIRNKIFLSGLSVAGEIRSQGLIDAVNFDEMRRRIVTIRPGGFTSNLFSQKIFMSDVSFLGPLNIANLGDISVDENLKRIQFEPNTNTIQVFRKKTITGALRVNSLLAIKGLINRVDFAEIAARAIRLSPSIDHLKFNKTLTIEGDVFMDNLLIDEKDGLIDGVKLTTLIPIETIGRNELIINKPILTQDNRLHGNTVRLLGSVQDCDISCSLVPMPNKSHHNIRPYDHQHLVTNSYHTLQPIPVETPQNPIYNQHVSYPPRPVILNGRNVTFMRTTPPYVTQTTSAPNIILTSPGYIQPRPQRSDTNNIRSLIMRAPVAIKFEKVAPEALSPIQPAPTTNFMIMEQIKILRTQIVSLNFVSYSANDLVVGFIEAITNDLSGLHFLEDNQVIYDQTIGLKSFLVLDQIDFPFLPTTYHLSVGVHTDQVGNNITSVYSLIGGSEFKQLSVLPIESPNSAKFLRIAGEQALFLLVSKDYNYRPNRNIINQCPANTAVKLPSWSLYQPQPQFDPVMEGVHVYLFHALQNSSSLTSAYFDLYQTIDLPAVDSFEMFSFGSSTYVLAVSRSTERIYLLLLRGYSGFQIVSFINAPMIESVKIMYTNEQKPSLIIHQTNGLHLLMDSIII